MKTLVVYYSLEGNTKEAAEQIAKAISADLLELKPIKDVPKEGGKKFFLGGMKAMFGTGTKLQTIESNPLEYDRIILGTPVWAGKPAPAIKTFLKKYEVKDKVSSLFTFSGSGNDEKCVANLKKKLPQMKHTITLIDRNNAKLATSNADKLNSFIGALQ